MSATYLAVPGAEPLAGAQELQLPRALALLDAIHQDRGAAVVALARIPGGSEGGIECLIIDLECDGVPTRNPSGLHYRERVAVLVSPNESEVPTVLALRPDFPALAHQNRVLPSTPASLCLYFEPPRTVLRTWTAPRFLQRIRWWLEKSARGELHPADQPVEGLFFASSHQLVLPSNYDAMRDQGLACQIAKGNDRTDGGATYFLTAAGTPVGQAKTGVLVGLSTPPVVSGAVEYDPATLGDLADLLAARGVDLLAALQAPLQALVPSAGAAVITPAPFTIILLHTPICRDLSAAPERLQRRAFIMPMDPLILGEATGALTALGGRYYTSAINMGPVELDDAWRALPCLPMEVLSENSPETARLQAGLAEPGPRGVVIGAGSLGSALLSLWGRSGWGQWSVIDNDYIRPHNLSRHVALAQHIGWAKVEVVTSLQNAVMPGLNRITPIVADACGSASAAVEAAVREAEVVIDASASLDYPRLASTRDLLPRHASLFVTPNSQSVVALIEDTERTQRLRTLEAQYYRALMTQAWGQEHLAGSPTFWSGASCRDISMVMPYSRLMVAAATLAEEVPALLRSPRANVRVWARRPGVGSIDVHDVPVEVERRFTLGELSVYVDEGMQRWLFDQRQRSLPAETGGVLLGYYDLNVHELVLVAALAAPPDSVATAGSFERGIEGLKAQVADAARRTAGVVQYVGEWHSHPPGVAATPSHDDLYQLIHLALAMGDEGLPGVQLIVGERDLSIAMSARAL